MLTQTAGIGQKLTLTKPETLTTNQQSTPPGKIVKASKYLFSLVTLFHILFTFQAANAEEILPKEICKEVGVPVCDVKSVDAFSAVDLNGDSKKEIIFAYDGGSCGEQHYVFMKQDMKWVQIANWCGMEGGAYKVLRTKHNGYFDIDTYVGKLRFNGKTYSKK